MHAFIHSLHNVADDCRAKPASGCEQYKAKLSNKQRLATYRAQRPCPHPWVPLLHLHCWSQHQLAPLLHHQPPHLLHLKRHDQIELYYLLATKADNAFGQRRHCLRLGLGQGVAMHQKSIDSGPRNMQDTQKMSGA